MTKLDITLPQFKGRITKQLIVNLPILLKFINEHGVSVVLADNYQEVLNNMVNSLNNESIEAILSSPGSHHGNLWSHVLADAFEEPEWAKCFLEQIQSEQEDKVKAQKAAVLRNLIGFEAAPDAIKRMMATFFSSIEDKRGGKRAGAGRPAVLKTRMVSLTLDEPTISHLKVKGKGNMSAGVRLLASEDMEKF